MPKKRDTAPQTQHPSNIKFLAKMSHELRTPLNVILANTQMLFQGFFGETSDTQKEKLSDIQTHANELLTLINDILIFSKSPKGAFPLNKTEFNISKFLQKILSDFEIFFYKKDITLDTQIADELHIFADQHRIKQVFNNLLTNAIKFTNQGIITVTLARDGDDIIIKVTDTGIGIDPKYHQKIFQDFFQVPSHKRGGTGLGLSIAKSFIEMHHGSLTVSSKHLEGSSFCIRLPRHEK